MERMVKKNEISRQKDCRRSKKAVSGCHIILFTTGRGTPFGAPVPTIKISSNSEIYNKKNKWIDFNAGRIVDGETIDIVSDDLLNLVLKIASGDRTRQEMNDAREIAIFKDGVTLQQGGILDGF